VGGDGAFAFTSQKLGNFSLTTSNGTAQRTFANLTPGAYDVAETVPADWKLESATCSDGSSPASINLAPGANVTCTFTNTRLNGLTIVKNAVGGDGSFAFTSQALGSFVLTTTNGTAQQAFQNLAPGTYAVSETVPAGWTLTSATCSGGRNPASITLAQGESVTCTFVNTKLASLTVVKTAVGGDGAFAFTSQKLGNFSLTTSNGTAQRTFADLAPGAYDVVETVPADWKLESATCSDKSNPASIALDPGENVTCTFTNRVVTALGEVDEPGVVTDRLYLPMINR
jgi:plastocyanin